MPARSILQLGDPRLLEKSQPVHEVASLATQAIITDLADTLAAFRQAHSYGRGIAAVQIGVLQRVIFIHMQPTGFCGPLLNPVITSASSEMLELWDDCFSFHGLMVKVRRHQRIIVNYINAAGESQTLEAEGPLAELLQHEIDHLDGILAIHRAISPDAFATREEWQRRYQSQKTPAFQNVT